MPQIPEGTYRPSFGEVVVDLLESIAMEEIAMSHILNAQGEKLQALVHQYATCNLSATELELGCRGTQDLMNSLIMKEWLLYNKLGNVMTLQEVRSPMPQTPCADYLPNPSVAGGVSNCNTCLHRPVCHPRGKWT